MSSKEVGFKEAGDASGSLLEELIVKSATNQVDDVVLKYDNLWSVKKLKERIADLYPCKLLVEDQKLIYSGKLLTDDLILKDIIRSFDDPEVNKKQKHIFHLVYSSKTKQAVPTPLQKTSPSPSTVSNTTTTQTMTDGLRQRHTQQSVGPELEGDSSSQNPANMISFPVGPAGPQYYMAQQMAMHNWMQQVYWQYMNQYMNLTNSSENRPPGSQPTMPQNFIPQIPAMPYFPATNFPQPTAASSHPQVPRPEPQQQMAAQAQPAQPRFPNIVQEEQENRDWLDIFYLGCRLMLFIMLIYFYSSAARCIVVIGGAIGIYMYHNGYFRNRNPVETNNNNVNNNDRNVEEERLQTDEEQLQQQRDDGVVESQPPIIAEEIRETGEADPELPNPGSSVMSIVKTFVVTFITSLLPDTQTL